MNPKRTLVTACLCALAATGCEKPNRPSVSNSPPKAGSPDLVSVPIASPAEPVGFIDGGGMVTQSEPVELDPVGVAHEAHARAVDHLTRATELRSDGDLDGALLEARRAVFDEPDSEDALSQTARLAKVRGDHLLAAEAFARVAELRPEDSNPRIQETRQRLRARDLEGAQSAGNDAVTRDATDPEAHHVVGRTHLAAGRLAEAIAAFEQVVELKSDHGFALNNLGFAYLRANENAKALEVLTRAAELLPSVAYVHNNLGVAFERMGQLEEAKLAYARSTSLSPKYVKARVNVDRLAKAPSTAPSVPEVESSDE